MLSFLLWYRTGQMHQGSEVYVFFLRLCSLDTEGLGFCWIVSFWQFVAQRQVMIRSCGSLFFIFEFFLKSDVNR